MKLGKGLLTLSVFFVSRLFAQTADEIIDKHVQAIGGLDAWRKVHSVKAMGVINQNGTEINFDYAVAHNKGVKQTITLGGLQGYTILTPTTGWKYFPWQGQIKPEALTPEDVQEAQEDIDAQTPLVDYKAKGHKAEYVGMDDFEGTDCYKVKVTEKGGKVVTYYIDPSNYFIIHSVAITKANGAENESQSSYSNYQKLPEGIWMPLKINSLRLKEVLVNAPVDDSLFNPTTN